MNPTLSSFQIPGRNNQHARHVRKAYGTPLSAEKTTSLPQDLASLELNKFLFDHTKVIVGYPGESDAVVEVYLFENSRDVHVVEKNGKLLVIHQDPLPENLEAETYGRRRRQAESFRRGWQISRAPSGVRHRPIRRSEVPRNLSDPGLAL
ncbi:unnamed protein product [Allacma fusca]|uniref:Uncharacterized protein n=1 Tax=Allacma fusca TaxID=39272 RepID=A0A8J2LAH0_9HEXA|nr:unnamed protein product [Allacma fusca]